jgi:hypothetical protein
MPRRRATVAPQTPIQVVEERLKRLNEKVQKMAQAGSSSVQVFDIDTYPDPYEGETVFDWPRERFCVFHLGDWWCTSMVWKTNRRVSTGTDAYVVSAIPAKYGGHYVVNDDPAAFMYVHLHDLASTPGASATPKLTIGIPPESAANIEYSGGVDFLVGISVGISASKVNGISGASTSVVATILYDN